MNTGLMYLLDTHYENIFQEGKPKQSKLHKLFWSLKHQQFISWHETDRDRHYPYGLIDPTHTLSLPDEIEAKKKELEHRTETNSRIKKEKLKDEKIKLYHPIFRKDVEYQKFYFATPEQVGRNIRDEIGGYNNHIRYTVNWAVDKKAFYGMPYRIMENQMYMNNVETTELKDARQAMIQTGISRQIIDGLLPLLFAHTPKLSACGFDIETLTRGPILPNPDVAPEPVTAASFVFDTPQKYLNGRKALVVALDNGLREVKRGFNAEALGMIKDEDLIVEWYESEIELLERIQIVLYECQFALLLTFNGDEFDLKYLRNRMIIHGIKDIPFIPHGKRKTEKAYMSYSPRKNSKLDVAHYKIHIDLYKFFKHPFIRNYAFSGKYTDNKLDTIAKALLGAEKVDYQGELNDLNLWSLVYYNWKDSKLLLDLLYYNNMTVLKLIFILMRLGFETMGEAVRLGVTDKIGNLFFWRASNRGWVMFRRTDLPKVKPVLESTTGKNFKGAMVIDPIPGIHFNVECHDFIGLYTNIAWKKNISPETMNCNHDGCIDNRVPQVGHHICRQEVGVASEIIGFITSIRSLHFKKLAKENPIYKPIEQALKVIGNSAYGFLTADFSSWYSIPSAESTTAFGRDGTETVKDKCGELDMTVIYGDTDSVFVTGATPEKVEELYRFIKETLGLELDLEKTAKFMLLTDRRKTYLFVYADGETDLKGLKLKKSSTPPFIREFGKQLVEILAKMNSEDDITPIVDEIKLLIKAAVRTIRKRKGVVEDYAFYSTINMRLNQYKNTNIQHVAAAKIEAQAIIDNLPSSVSNSVDLADLIPKGKIQGFIKTNIKQTGFKVLPLSVATTKDIDVNKYINELASTFEQITGALGINIGELVAPAQQMKLFA